MDLLVRAESDIPQDGVSEVRMQERCSVKVGIVEIGADQEGAANSHAA
jgi:hypothetical protein